MKNFTFFPAFVLVALLSITAWAQNPWELQRAFGLPNWVNPAARYSALDDNVCWGISSISPLYLRTTNGGQNWTVSTITGATGGFPALQHSMLTLHGFVILVVCTRPLMAD